jgi:hypothetical protein
MIVVTTIFAGPHPGLKAKNNCSIDLNNENQFAVGLCEDATRLVVPACKTIFMSVEYQNMRPWDDFVDEESEYH